MCEDPSVLGRTFYLMGWVDGWSPMNTDGWPAPFDTDLEARKGLAYQLVEGIALLGNVDWQAKGLQDLGRPDGFHERQVDRWTAFLERIKGRELPGFDEASAWLRAHKPIDFVPGLMHGDYQFANVMFKDGAPARLAALIDWEMGTVGDPKLDLGWVVQSWPDDTESPEYSGSGGYADMNGMPSRDKVVQHYADDLRPPGRRPRLLHHPGQVEARGGARAGLPAAGRRREAPGVRPDRARPHAGRGRPRRDHGLRAVAVRAARVLEHGPPESVVVEEVPDPVPGPGEVLVDIAYAAVNFPDVLIVANEYQVQLPGAVRAGERVLGRGRARWGMASTTSRSATTCTARASSARTRRGSSCTRQSVTVMPDSVDLRDAAAFSVAHTTAIHALRTIADLQEGETVLVLGAAGGVGLATVELATLMGARVVAAASTPAKLDAVREVRRGRRHRLHHRGPQGAGQGAHRRWRRHRDRPGRRAVLGAGAAGDEVGESLRRARVRRRARSRASRSTWCCSRASSCGAWRCGAIIEHVPELVARDMRELRQLFADGKIHPHVSAVYPLADTAVALRSMLERTATGKVLIDPSNPRPGVKVRICRL